MSVIGQPESYSDMLKRIFTATAVVAVVCAFVLARYSPAVKTFLDSWDAEASVPVVEGLKALYVLVPLLIALLARLYRLHNRISDALRLRKRFDTQHILRPLMAGVGLPTEGEGWEAVMKARHTAMTRTFYRYASFHEPKIDNQLVRTAADQWAWYWSLLEPQLVLAVTAIALVAIDANEPAAWVAASMVAMSLMAWGLWPSLKRGARAQVEEILTVVEWKNEVRLALREIMK